MNKSIQKMTTFKPDFYQKYVVEVMEKLNVSSFSEFIRMAVRVFKEDNEDPAYIANRKVFSPQEKAEAKLKVQQEFERQKEEAGKQKQIDICTSLQGRVEMDPKGYNVCIYPRWEHAGGTNVRKYDDRQPLDFIKADLINYQYNSIEGKGDIGKSLILELLTLKENEMPNL